MANGITRYSLQPEVVQLIFGRSLKQAAQQLIDQVSDQASWDDIMYELYVKQKLEKGLKAVTDGRIVSQEEAKKRLLGNAS